MSVPVCDFHVVELVVEFLIVPVADAVGMIVLIVAIVVVDDVVVVIVVGVVVVVLVFALLVVVVAVAVVVVVFLETGLDKVIACVIPVRHLLQDHPDHNQSYQWLPVCLQHRYVKSSILCLLMIPHPSMTSLIVGSSLA